MNISDEDSIGPSAAENRAADGKASRSAATDELRESLLTSDSEEA